MATVGQTHSLNMFPASQNHSCREITRYTVGKNRLLRTRFICHKYVTLSHTLNNRTITTVYLLNTTFHTQFLTDMIITYLHVTFQMAELQRAFQLPAPNKDIKQIFHAVSNSLFYILTPPPPSPRQKMCKKKKPRFPGISIC